MTDKNHFVELAGINVNEHVEKKANLSYLSWAWAVDQLMRADSQANWVFHEPVMFGETMMVSCTVTAFGKPMTMHLPVMDHRNQAIKNPDAFQVNKNMMRCLVKAIAVHGLGLYIYAGEDLPEGDPQQPPAPTYGEHEHKAALGAISKASKKETIDKVLERAKELNAPEKRIHELRDAGMRRIVELTEDIPQ
jgi:hypothetical protein